MFDELLLLGVAAAFVIIMVVSWLRTRNQPDTLTDDPLQTDIELPLGERKTAYDRDDSPDRFKLD
ncbi:MAG: hypothetical protein IPK19_03885 [Chloroflexi bacterium]|nr:hypothetical protein [Chloroflexota bacterium]